jgi:hypothetical protein
MAIKGHTPIEVYGFAGARDKPDSVNQAADVII